MYSAYLFNTYTGEVRQVGTPGEKNSLLSSGGWITLSYEEYGRFKLTQKWALWAQKL